MIPASLTPGSKTPDRFALNADFVENKASQRWSKGEGPDLGKIKLTIPPKSKITITLKLRDATSKTLVLNNKNADNLVVRLYVEDQGLNIKSRRIGSSENRLNQKQLISFNKNQPQKVSEALTPSTLPSAKFSETVLAKDVKDTGVYTQPQETERKGVHHSPLDPALQKELKDTSAAVERAMPKPFASDSDGSESVDEFEDFKDATDDHDTEFYDTNLIPDHQYVSETAEKGEALDKPVKTDKTEKLDESEESEQSETVESKIKLDTNPSVRSHSSVSQDSNSDPSQILLASQTLQKSKPSKTSKTSQSSHTEAPERKRLKWLKNLRNIIPKFTKSQPRSVQNGNASINSSDTTVRAKNILHSVGQMIDQNNDRGAHPVRSAFSMTSSVPSDFDDDSSSDDSGQWVDPGFNEGLNVIRDSFRYTPDIPSTAAEI